MSKKLIISLSILGLIGFSGFASAGSNIDCSMTPRVVEVSVSDGTIAWGNQDLGTSIDTMTLNDTQTVSNSGTVSVDVFIKGNNTADWTLVSYTDWDTNQNLDEYSNRYKRSDDADWQGDLTTTFVDSNTDLGLGVSRDFDFQASTPYSASTYDTQNWQIEFMATAL